MSATISCTRLVLLAVLVATTGIASQPLSAKEVYLRQWPAGRPTPPLKLNDLDGKEWNAHGLRGKVVILNFWASWCAPCVEELPFLNELANSVSTKDKVMILGLNFKESAAAIQRFSNEHKLDFPILMDTSGEHFKKWADGILPTTVLIDRNGRPRWRIVGELDRSNPGLKLAVEKLLAEPAQADAGRIRAIAN